MKKVLKKYFIPHPENDHRPHFLREKSVLAMTGFTVLVFLLTLVQFVVITKTDLIATILPGVLTDLANQDRTSFGLSPLKVNPVLQKAAALKAADMAAKGYFAHISPEGVNPWHWFRLAGYDFMVAGENLAVDFSESLDVERAWMASPTHRENILRQEFTEIGIATANGTYQGRPTTFVVQLFGRPTPKFTEATSPEPVLASPTPTPSASSVANPPSAAPVVAGETQSQTNPAAVTPLPETAETLTLETLAEDDLFIAVRNVDAAEVPEDTSGGTLGQESYASFFEKLLLSPKRTLGVIYLALGILIVIAILLMVGVEIGRHHPRHIIYGLLLLVLIIGLFYLYREIIITEVLIV